MNNTETVTYITSSIDPRGTETEMVTFYLNHNIHSIYPLLNEKYHGKAKSFYVDGRLWKEYLFLENNIEGEFIEHLK